MKFQLVPVVLLLLPVAFADLPPPTAKILYDSDGDYAISESYDARILRYEYEGDLLIVQVKTNNTNYISEFMHLRRNEFKKQNFSFAIEAYEETEKEPGQTFCRQESSEGLRHLIDKCYAKIVLRDLSQEERKQISEFKENEKGIQSSFKMVYKRRSIKTKTVSLKFFEFRDFNTNGRSDFLVFVNSYNADRKYVRLIGLLAEKSFVVENLPVGKYKCHHTGLPDLKPVECNGQIQLRKITDDD